jgi:hypothetical protein
LESAILEPQYLHLVEGTSTPVVFFVVVLFFFFLRDSVEIVKFIAQSLTQGGCFDMEHFF